ncbi:MAG: putative addiction module antidote protein [Methylococcaceae bacterium]|nr:putative addiction module antidote protein [Methylococcaceae bacterium]
MTLKTKPFEFASNVESKEDIAMYLSIFLEENGVDGLTQALQYLAKAKGMNQIANETGLNRQSLYRTLTAEGKPKFETIDKIVHALGFKLTIEPI